MPTTQMSALSKRRGKNINIIFLALLAALTCGALFASATYAESEVVQIQDKTLYYALKNCPEWTDPEGMEGGYDGEVMMTYDWAYQCAGFEGAEYDDATQTITFPGYSSRSISLPHQGLVDISDIGKFNYLGYINLSHNNITSFDITTSLQLLDLTGTEIFQYLKWNLSDNKIEHISAPDRESFRTWWYSFTSLSCWDYDRAMFYYPSLFGQNIEKEVESTHYELPNIANFLNSDRIFGNYYNWDAKPFNQIYSIYLENAELSSDKKSVEIPDKTKTAIVSYRMNWDDYRSYLLGRYGTSLDSTQWNNLVQALERRWGNEGYINLATIKLNYHGEDMVETSPEPTQQVQNPGTSDFYPIAVTVGAIATITALGLLYAYRRRNA